MPAGLTYEPLATTTLTSTQTDIVFSSISSAYTDLKLVVSGTTTASVVPALRFNSDSASNYSNTTLRGNGSTVGSGRLSNTNELFVIDSLATSTTIPILISVDIFNYAGTTNKTTLSCNAGDLNGSGGVERVVGLWRNTAAINAITILGRGTTWAIGTTATLYGIKAA